MKKFERKVNYIDGKVQGSLVKRIFIHWISFFVATGTTFVLLQAFLGNPDLPFVERISRRLSEFSLLAMIMFAILPAFALDTIRFSNRFVGPIMRLRRAMRELNQHGNCERLKFRDDDFWQEMAAEFNQIADRVEKQKFPGVKPQEVEV